MFASRPVGCTSRRFAISRPWDCGPSDAPRASARGASPWVSAPLHASASSRRRASPDDAALARARVTTRASTSGGESRAASAAAAGTPTDGVRRRAIRRPAPTPISVSDAVPSTSTGSDEPDDARCPERSPPRTKSSTARAKRGGKNQKPKPPRDANDANDANDASSASRRAAPRRRERPRRGARSKSTSARDSKDPFDEYGGVLTAEQEAELGGAIQELLRVEAMEKRLADESIARELRQESEGAAGADATADVFSKDFGKTTSRSRKSSAPPSVGRDVNSPAFRRELAQELRLDSPATLQRIVDRGQSARRAFVTRNANFARRVALELYEKLNPADKGILSLSDLTQEGCAGLARAADKFDPARGYKFTTYSYFWVRKAVIDSINNCGRTIRLPVYMCETLQRKKRETRAFLHARGRYPTDEELSHAMGVSLRRIKELEQWAMAAESLDETREDADGNRSERSDVALALATDLSGSNLDSARLAESAAVADIEADLLGQDLEDALSTLLPRERFVLRHRFGLASATTKALGSGSYEEEDKWLKANPAEAEDALRAARSPNFYDTQDAFNPGEHGGVSRALLGPLLGVSAETVRTVERRALAKLKDPRRAGHVLSWLDPEARDRSVKGNAETFADAVEAAVVAANERRAARARGVAARGGGGGGGDGTRRRKNGRVVRVAGRGAAAPTEAREPAEDETRVETPDDAITLDTR
jgi:RNA polymerase sigma factor (sigma-70 family)